MQPAWTPSIGGRYVTPTSPFNWDAHSLLATSATNNRRSRTLYCIIITSAVMPPSRSEKKGLTLEKLASYDDIITDALVDKVSRVTMRAAESLSPLFGI